MNKHETRVSDSAVVWQAIRPFTTEGCVIVPRSLTYEQACLLTEAAVGQRPPGDVEQLRPGGALEVSEAQREAIRREWGSAADAFLALIAGGLH